MIYLPIYLPGLRQKHRTEEVARAAESAEEHARRVEQELDRLSLACAALWSLVKEHGHTDEELLARMEELDLRDGRLSHEVQTCAGCGRRTRSSARRRACLYCGESLPAGPPFS